MNNFVLAKNEEDIKRITCDYVYYDTGFDELIIAKEDVAKAVAATANHINATIFYFDSNLCQHIITTTIGCFLDRTDQAWRAENIEALNAYQQQEREIGTIYCLLNLDNLDEEGCHE